MSDAEQVIFVSRLALAVGPLALYFVVLGLVNSQARPCLVGARSDFLGLSVVVVPLVVSPCVALIEHGMAWAAWLVVAGVLVAGRRLMPARDSGWVLYNTTRAQCDGLVARACRRLNWSADCDGETVTIQTAAGGKAPAGVSLRLHLRELGWMRNVTIEAGGDAGRMLHARFAEALSAETRREAALPSPVGASLVLLGSSLLALPAWYLGHHMPAIVEVVRSLLFA